MKKKLIFASLIFFYLTAAAYIYIDRILLPVKFKRTIIKEAEKFLNRDLTLKAVHFSPLKGFIIEGVTVFEKGRPGIPFIYVERITFNILYVPFFKEKKIIIPSITAEKPVVEIIRERNNRFNFSDILAKQEKSESPMPSVIVGALTINGASLKFFDLVSAGKFSDTIENINLKAGFSLPQNIKFSAEWTDPRRTMIYLSAKGDYQIPTKSFTGQITLRDVPLAKYVSAYYDTDSFHLKSGNIKTANISIIWENETFDIKSDAAIENARVNIQNDKELFISPLIRGAFQYDPRLENKFSYKIALDPRAASLKGLPFIDQVKEINGVVEIEPDKVTLSAVSGNIKDDKIYLSGLITGFSHPQCDLKLSGDIELTRLKDIFPNFLEKEKLELSGKASLAAVYQGSLYQPEADKIRFTAVLNKASLNTPKLPLPLNEITGQINYTPQEVTWQNLNMLAADTKIQSSGSLTNFTQPLIDCRGTVDTNLEIFKTAFFDFFEQSKINTTGHAKIDFSYKGPALLPLEADYQVHATLANAAITAKILPSAVENISGEINLSPNLLTWENLNAKFQDNIYTLNGTLKDFSRPILESTLVSNNTELKTSVKILRRVFSFTSLAGRYFHSQFDITGDLSTPENEDPLFDFKGSAKIDPKDLSLLFPSFKEKIDALNPRGILSLSGIFKGQIDHWRDWEISLDATIPEFSIKEYKINNAVIKFAQRDNNISQCDLSGLFYGGKISFQSSADLRDSDIAYNFLANLEEIDLAQLKNDTVLKTQNISGLLSGHATVSGLLQDLNSLKGQGSLALSKGRIWEINLFKGLGQFLLIPEFEEIIFKEASGDFTVENGQAKTDNLTLISNSVDLTCQGTIDFLGNLNFDILSEFSPETIAESASLKKSLTAFLAAGNYLKIKLTGTLKEPKYKVSFSSGEIIERTKDLLIDGLQGIFQ